MAEHHALIENYERGLLTRAELVNQLIELAATVRPSDYIPRLPTDLRQHIEENHHVRCPPASWQEIVSIGSVCNVPGVDQAAADADRCQKTLMALRALRDYFDRAMRQA